MTRKFEEADRLLAEYVAEVSATPKPTRKQWQAQLDKWRGKVNVSSLLTYGADKGWLKP